MPWGTWLIPSLPVSPSSSPAFLSLSLPMCVGVSPSAFGLLWALTVPLQSRRLLRELKVQRHRHLAASTISAYWKGYKVTGPAPPAGPRARELLCPAVRPLRPGLSVCLPWPTLSGWGGCPVRAGPKWGGGRARLGRGECRLIPMGPVGWGGCGGEVPVPALTAAPPQVRRMYRRYFRSGAGTRLANFIYRRLVSRAGGEGARRLPAPQQWGWARGPRHPPPFFPPPRCRSSSWGCRRTSHRWRCRTGPGPRRPTNSWRAQTRS